MSRQLNYESFGLPKELEASPEPKGKANIVEGQQGRKRAIKIAMRMEREQPSVRIKTPIGDAIFDQGSVNHIADRIDQRYQFAHLIRPTLEQPNEIWSVVMNNGAVRLVYVKQFVGKCGAVIVEKANNRVITAIVRSKTTDANRWRRGCPVYIQKEWK